MSSVRVLPLNTKLEKKAKKLGVAKKLQKAIDLFEYNPFHPGLNTELLEPKAMGFWSFRVDRKVRAIFFFREDKQVVEIVSLTLHYR